VPCVDGVDEVSGGVVDCAFGEDFPVADGDDDRSQWLKGLDDSLDRCPGLVLKVAGHPEGGKDHCEVNIRLTGVHRYRLWGPVAGIANIAHGGQQ